MARPTYKAEQGTLVYDYENDVVWAQRGVGTVASWQLLEQSGVELQSPANFGLMTASTGLTYASTATLTASTPSLTCVHIPHKAVVYGFRCIMRSSGAITSGGVRIKARPYEPYMQTSQSYRPGKALTDQKTLDYTFPAVSGSGTNVLIGFKFDEPFVFRGGLMYLYTSWDWDVVGGGFPANTTIESRTMLTGSPEIPRDWYSVPTRTWASYDAPDEFGVYQSFDDQGSQVLGNDPDAYAWRWFGGGASELAMRINWTPIWRAIA